MEVSLLAPFFSYDFWPPFVPTLSVQVRQYAAVILRKKLVKVWTKLSAEDKQRLVRSDVW